MPCNRIAFVCGGRDFDDSARLLAVLDAEHSRHPFSCLVHGAARGADSPHSSPQPSEAKLNPFLVVHELRAEAVVAFLGFIRSLPSRLASRFLSVRYFKFDQIRYSTAENPAVVLTCYRAHCSRFRLFWFRLKHEGKTQWATLEEAVKAADHVYWACSGNNKSKMRVLQVVKGIPKNYEETIALGKSSASGSTSHANHGY